jgi:hypothetical protein
MTPNEHRAAVAAAEFATWLNGFAAAADRLDAALATAGGDTATLAEMRTRFARCRPALAAVGRQAREMANTIDPPGGMRRRARNN